MTKKLTMNDKQFQEQLKDNINKTITFKNTQKDNFIDIHSVSITMTLKPTLYEFTARKQLQQSLKCLRDILPIFLKSYVFVPELTKQSNIHYHILGTFNDKPYIEDQLRDLLKLSYTMGSNINISKPFGDQTNLNRAWEYIFKDIVRTNTIINKKKTSNMISLHYTNQWDRVEQNETKTFKPKGFKKVLVSDLFREDSEESETMKHIIGVYGNILYDDPLDGNTNIHKNDLYFENEII